ncbi:hypothetical protein ACFO1V_02345, partial [Daeguia caeni]
RLFLMSSAPSQVRQTLHHSEGTSGGQVKKIVSSVVSIDKLSLPTTERAACNFSYHDDGDVISFADQMISVS